MGPLGLIELQGARNAVDDALRDSGGVATLKPGVVLARDPRQKGDLIAAQPRDPSAVSAINREPSLHGGNSGPARAQELPDLPADVATDVAVVCHAFTLWAFRLG
jgi:hypothetical protein